MSLLRYRNSKIHSHAYGLQNMTSAASRFWRSHAIFLASCRPRRILPDFTEKFRNWCIFWKIAGRKKSDSDQKRLFVRSPLTKEYRLDHWNFQDDYIPECSMNAENIRPPTFANQKLWVRKLDKYVHFFIHWMFHEIVAACIVQRNFFCE